MKWLVQDPQGAIHTIEKDKDQVWWGMENIGKEAIAGSSKNIIRGGLQRTFEAGQDHGFYGLYTWLKVPQ